MSGGGPTAALGAFAATLGAEALPAGTLAKTKGLFLDFLRVTFVGSRYPWSRKVYDVVCRMGGADRCTILVRGGRTGAPQAAFANGTFAHGIDWDDTHIGSLLHAGVTAFPAALAVAELAGACGRDFLAAAAAGYDVTIRIGQAIQPGHLHHGFHGTATCGTFGAAAAAGRLLGLSPAAMAHAFGICGSSAAGLASFFRYGSMVKRVQVGRAAEAGVMAALLAHEGITAMPGVLEDELGFCRSYAHEVFGSHLTDGLGKTFKVDEVLYKTHAGGGHFHAAIDAALALGREHRVPVGEIASVRVGIIADFAARGSHTLLADLQAAQMSLPFNVALGLWVGARDPRARYLAPEDYEAGLADAEVVALARRTAVEHDPEVAAQMDAVNLPSRVSIRTAGGREFSRFVRCPWGNPGNPLTDADLSARFHAAADPMVGPEAAREIEAAVANLEGAPHLGELVRRCVARP